LAAAAGIERPVLAAELVRDAADIVMVYRGSDAFRAELKSNTICDFFFIAAYGAMFFVMGRWTGGRLGAAISMCAVVAALAEVAENVGILRTIYGAPITDALARSTSGPSLVKWSLLGAICLLAAAALTRAGEPILQRLTWATYLFAGATIGWSLFVPLTMQYGLLLLSIAVVLQLAMLIRS
jgi:hypothetical protein